MWRMPSVCLLFDAAAPFGEGWTTTQENQAKFGLIQLDVALATGPTTSTSWPEPQEEDILIQY
jgi:hypothetical protein